MPEGLIRGAPTATTSFVAAMALRRAGSDELSPGWGSSARSTSGPLNPGPKPCERRLNASYVLVLLGSLPASLLSRRSDVTGITNTAITASDASASGHGRACTISLQRRHSDSRGAAPATARCRARRDGRTIFGPKRESSAGSTVSDASITNSTANTDASESPYMKLTPVANIPSSAITTVVPASKIARPEVSIASSTASRVEPSRR